jgi:hypothetical protein
MEAAPDTQEAAEDAAPPVAAGGVGGSLDLDAVPPELNEPDLEVILLLSG